MKRLSRSLPGIVIIALATGQFLPEAAAEEEAPDLVVEPARPGKKPSKRKLFVEPRATPPAKLIVEARTPVPNLMVEPARPPRKPRPAPTAPRPTPSADATTTGAAVLCERGRTALEAVEAINGRLTHSRLRVLARTGDRARTVTLRGPYLLGALATLPTSGPQPIVCVGVNSAPAGVLLRGDPSPGPVLGGPTAAPGLVHSPSKLASAALESKDAQGRLTALANAVQCRPGWRLKRANLGPAIGVIAAKAVTHRCARRILRGIPEPQRANLRQLMFIMNLKKDASGSAGEPRSLLARFQRELGRPLVVSTGMVARLLTRMRQVAAKGRHPQDRGRSQWARVRTMLDAVVGDLPGADECWQRILDYPPRVVAAFLLNQYFSGRHYHPYRMQVRIFKALARDEIGAYGLALIEHWLKKYQPAKRTSVTGLRFGQAVEAAQRIFGTGFASWYRFVRGRDYADEMRKWEQGRKR